MYVLFLKVVGISLQISLASSIIILQSPIAHFIATLDVIFKTIFNVFLEFSSSFFIIRHHEFGLEPFSSMKAKENSRNVKMCHKIRSNLEVCNLNT